MHAADVYPQDSTDSESIPSQAFVWPDISSAEGATMPENEVPVSHALHIVREQAGEPEMDFSLSHFVQSTISPPTGNLPPPQAPQAASFGMEGFFDSSESDAMHQWHQPFNYAAMLDMAYATFQLDQQ